MQKWLLVSPDFKTELALACVQKNQSCHVSHCKVESFCPEIGYCVNNSFVATNSNKWQVHYYEYLNWSIPLFPIVSQSLFPETKEFWDKETDLSNGVCFTPSSQYLVLKNRKMKQCFLLLKQSLSSWSWEVYCKLETKWSWNPVHIKSKCMRYMKVSGDIKVPKGKTVT